MKALGTEFEGRLRHWLRVLQDDFYRPLGEIRFEAARTMDRLSPEDAGALPFEEVSPGFTWGNVWEYCWFKGTVVLPEEAFGKRIVMDLRPGGESTLYVNGRSFGTYRAPWIRYPHHYMEDNFLTDSGVPGDCYDVLMETYAGHDFPEAPGGGCAVGPVLPGSYEPRIENDDRRTLGFSTYGIWNEDAYQLFMDANTLWKLYETLDPSSLRAAKVAEALEQFTLTADFEKAPEARDASYRAAREALAPALKAQNGTTAPDFFAVGNAHIDLAWLWPMAETERKTVRTFAAQLRLLQEYPDYYFLQSQPSAYEMCRDIAPELFERIREAIKEGRWIAEGAMWVEPDTNLAGGEALVRQLLYGIQYYKDVLGTESRILWLPDTFGYSGALPQILAKCGVKYLVTQKIFWSYNDGERFPYHYFTWQGIDGTRVTAFLPTSYTYDTDPESMNKVWQGRSQVRDLESFLIPYGYGDGGGGPARDHIEYLERERDLEGMPRIRQGNPLTFFEELEAKGGPKNTYAGELYFDAHRGTYTSQAVIKKNNRKAELALRDMEFSGALAVLRGNGYARDTADRLWKELLLHQFHDILPGSGIERIYVEADRRVKAVISEAEALTEDYLKAVAGEDERAVSVVNTLSFPRKALVKLPEHFAAGAVTKDGAKVPTEKTADGVYALTDLPPMASVTLYPAAGNEGREEPVTPESLFGEKSGPKAFASREEDGFILENDVLFIRLNQSGEIVSIRRKDTGREFAGGVMNRFRLYKDVPRLYDAWDIDSNYIDQELPGLTDASVRILKLEGLYAALELRGTLGNSALTQEIVLTADAERIEFRTTVDWKELHRLFKVSFPTDVYTETGVNEVQFGYVERPTHRSRRYDKDRFEVSNHRYSALHDGSHGFAVLNDCKYGISMNGSALELTLLRAPAAPEMRADNRVHTFTYAALPFEGAFAESNVVREGLDLNVPAKPVEGVFTQEPLVNISRKNVILDTVKPAEDGSGDLILRFYEAQKAAGMCTVETALRGRAWITDLLEQKEREVPFEDGVLELSFGPFEIVTVRVQYE
ncbi:MAG: alpha-mannosidase [Lachnospiraceae bacterium]|nr:alpha-mannosidase [Lachnospiraceae bacterium]